MLRSLYKIIISCNSSTNITEVNSRLVSTKVGLLPPEVKKTIKSSTVRKREVGHGHVCHVLKLEEKKDNYLTHLNTTRASRYYCHREMSGLLRLVTSCMSG